MSKFRDAIINSARKLFSDKNFEQVTIREICADAGVANSTFYYHFKTKEELMDYLQEKDRQPLQNEWIGLATITDLMEQVIASCSMCAARAERHGYTLTAQYYKRQLSAEKTDTIHQETCDQELEASILLIRQAQERGIVTNRIDASSLAHAAIALTSGIIVEWCISSGGFNLRTEVHNALLILLRS